MEFLVIGDPHFKVSNVGKTTLMTQAILGLARSRSFRFIVVLGDVLHKHSLIDMIPLCAAENFLVDLSEISPTFVLIGNHDRLNNSDFMTSTHPFTGLKRANLPNLRIVEASHREVIDDIPFAFVPYVPPGMFRQALDTIQWTDVKVIFAHQEFRGVAMGAKLSETGDQWSPELPLVVSGHIHQYSQLASNIIYTGTPIQENFGEQDEKSVSIFSLADGVVSHSRVSLGLPRDIEITLAASEVSTFVPPANDNIKIKIVGTTAERKALMKSIKVKELERAGVKVQYERVTTVPNASFPTYVEAYENREEGYRRILYNVVSQDKGLLDLYTEIFS